MPRLVPDLTILIRPKGNRKPDKIEIFMDVKHWTCKANGRWFVDKEGNRVRPVRSSFRDVLWRSIKKHFYGGYDV